MEMRDIRKALAFEATFSFVSATAGQALWTSAGTGPADGHRSSLDEGYGAKDAKFKFRMGHGADCHKPVPVDGHETKRPARQSAGPGGLFNGG
jgi:hypothetical protein